MKPLLILLTLLCVACDQNRQPLTKPFVIVDKFPSSGLCNDGYCRYIFQDANGNTRDICEDVNKYSVGDTIK